MALNKLAVSVFLLSISPLSYGNEEACTRSTCYGGEAVTYSPKEAPALACPSPAICTYVNFYLETEGQKKNTHLDADTTATLETLRKRARVKDFQEASEKTFPVPHKQRVKINSVNYSDDLANVSPINGDAPYWISFDSLSSIKKTPLSYANNGNPTRGSAILAALVNADTGIYNFSYLDRKSNSLLPQSFDENIAFTLEEVAPRGGQIFVCSTKRNCDAIYAHFDALIGLAGPYLYRSKDGKVVAQLNKGLSPLTAEAFENALRQLK